MERICSHIPTYCINDYKSAKIVGLERYIIALNTISMNAQQEFISHIGKRRVKCVKITYNERDVNLKLNYTSEEYNQFLKQLDFSYDAGYGGQELFGTIWYEDGNTWSERGEYDGSEWWVYYIIPTIPNSLLIH